MYVFINNTVHVLTVVFHVYLYSYTCGDIFRSSLRILGLELGLGLSSDTFVMVIVSAVCLHTSTNNSWEPDSMCVCVCVNICMVWIIMCTQLFSNSDSFTYAVGMFAVVWLNAALWNYVFVLHLFPQLQRWDAGCLLWHSHSFWHHINQVVEEKKKHQITEKKKISMKLTCLCSQP